MQRTSLVLSAIALMLGLIIADVITLRPLSDPLKGKTYLKICELVRDNYYEESERLNEWVLGCIQRANQFNSERSLNSLLDEVSQYLDELHVSHLSIWDPMTMRSQWLGESKETGLRVIRIQNHFIVVKLVEDGPAMKAGLKNGDEIISINGRPIQQAWEARSTSGRFQVARLNRETRSLDELEFVVIGEDIRLDQRPTFELVDDEGGPWGVLSLPSFVASYFEDESWNETVKNMIKAKKLVVDLRKNSGGNFAAMLKALSPFFCDPTEIGRLIKPRVASGTTEELQNNLDPNYQTEVIERSRIIVLKTFKNSLCYTREVTVLIDSESASTTEVFAQAMSFRKNTRILGDFSAGEVVQAVWHPLPLGEGYALSIPDSMYVTIDEVSLEGVGVRPIKLLEYELDDARQGIDSWINQAFD